jgi:energy-coupling factor transporter ATP-binding protein EcfA2
MLGSLKVSNFTVFSDQAFNFGSGLNVVIGRNGTGKTHLFKLAYSVVSAIGAKGETEGTPTKTNLNLNKMAKKLVNVFRPDELGRLASRSQGVTTAEVEATFENSMWNCSFSFNSKSKSDVAFDQLPKTWADLVPAYLPTRELLTIYPGFVSLYDGRYLEFDETWRDTCVLLGEPLKKGAREKDARSLLDPLEKAMAGQIVVDAGGRFYLDRKPGGRIEMHLVAEGLRKLGMMARLIANGALLDKAVLFWDEPEANLNPQIIKTIAQCIVAISEHLQVFVATHSLFLLREFELILRQKKQLGKFFGLQFENKTMQKVVVDQGNSLSDLGIIDSLEEELLQSDRALEAEQAS